MPTRALKGLMLIQDHFKARPTDIFLASSPKYGTTWLKALIFTTITQTRYDFANNPLLSNSPREFFPFLDSHIHHNESISSLEALPSPRLLSTHFPYALLPDSITASGCRFIHICRNPKDVLISKWIFMNKARPKDLPPLSLEEAFELFCKGISHYGPYLDHVLGYWKASLEYPEKILFLKYEDIKREPLVYVKRLAEFLGHPFSVEEESEGVVQDIIRLCSFENLSNLEVNKTSEPPSSTRIVHNHYFFRKGQVGDWKNYLTPEMVERLDHIIEEKLCGSGFSFGFSQ